MEQLGISALANLLDDAARAYVTAGDLKQVIVRLQNRQKQKQVVQPGADTRVETRQIKYVRTLIKRFAGRRKIPKAELSAAVDKILRHAHLNYYHEKHPVANPNVYWSAVPDNPHRPSNISSYDVAFYSPQASLESERDYHHLSRRGDASVFFIRCEERNDDELLIGNIQIDDKGEIPWRTPSTGELLLKPQNLEVRMIQEAVKYALDRGFKKIYFQAGAAMQIAQFDEIMIDSIKITPRHQAFYQEKHKKDLARFDGLRPGAVVGTLNSLKITVYDRTTTTLACCALYPESDNLYVAAMDVLRDTENKSVDTQYVNNTVFEGAVRRYDAGEVLGALNLLIRQLNSKADITSARAAKLKFIQRWIDLHRAKKANHPNHLAHAFLVKFGYENVILTALPQLKKYDLPDAGEVYIDTMGSYNYSLPRTLLKAPVLGKTYRIFPGAAAEDFPELMIDIRPEYRLFRWYDERLPKLFKKAGLTYELQNITTEREERRMTVPVYVLEARSLERFAHTPRRVFATHPHRRPDTHTLAELTAAAQKFGLTSRQLVVANEWIMAEGVRRTGYYDSATDTIQITAKNLGLLAHEGLHRLVARDMIPAKEYQALVATGRALARRHPPFKKYIEKVDAAGRSLYPAGPARDQEYAALCAEYYYTHKAALQKHLSNKKLTQFEQIIDYVRQVLEIIATKFGHQPAQAASFLRRVAVAPSAGRPRVQNNFAESIRAL